MREGRQGAVSRRRPWFRGRTAVPPPHLSPAGQGDRQEEDRARRQGDHVRLGRPVTQTALVEHGGHEDRHGRGSDGDSRARRPGRSRCALEVHAIAPAARTCLRDTPTDWATFDRVARRQDGGNNQYGCRGAPGSRGRPHLRQSRGQAR